MTIGLRAYGESAQRLLEGFERDVPVIAFSRDGLREAYHDARERRAQGMHFWAMPLLRTVKHASLLASLGAIFRAYSTPQLHFEGLRLLEAGLIEVNGVRYRDFRSPDADTADGLRAILSLSYGLVARSWEELSRLAALAGTRPSSLTVLPLLDPLVPPPVSRTALEGIVIWAPRYDANEVSLLAVALEEVLLPVAIYCNGGEPPPAMKAEFRRLDSSTGQHLANARCILVADHEDPAAVLSLAAFGVPLAAPVSCGAYEYFDNVALFDYEHIPEIYRATMRGLALPPPRAKGERPRADSLRIVAEMAETCAVPK
ncbi:MAG TPA: hypothetical protein VMD07_04825 [Candidatus Acidoferrales bacterium]|nr:hypothetical protein [Candidatus Acidoferrales bacterium]